MVRGTVTDWTEYCQNKVSSLFRRSEPGNEYELLEGLAMFLYLGKRMLNCTFGHIGNLKTQQSLDSNSYYWSHHTPPEKYETYKYLVFKSRKQLYNQSNSLKCLAAEYILLYIFKLFEKIWRF